jgi:phosphonatase-like hydrolase
MSIELIVFDIAGTTVKDNGEITIAFKAAMLQFGYEIPSDAITPLMGYKKPLAIKMMLDDYEPEESIVTVDLINEIHSEFVKLMVDYYKGSTTVEALPYAEDIFVFLRQQGIKIGLDTGFSKEITDVIIDKLGWLKDNKIDCVVCSDEVPLGRPHPYMIKKIMEQTGITDSQKVIKVGDTEADINEGKNAHCKYTIAITTGAFTKEELEPFEPSHIINHLSELVPIILPLL